MSIHTLLMNLIPDLEAHQANQFDAYYKMLVERNKKVNLTAIIQPEEVAQKHFADSLLPICLIPHGARCADIGTGAGFPGIPIKIMRPDIELVMIDSLQKRIAFITDVCAELKIEALAIHSRAEDAGQNPKFRESFDIVLTRAVAPANTLLEWTVPLLRVGGCSIMYKGTSPENEIAACKNALKILSVESEIKNYTPAWGARSIIIAKKLAPTPRNIPRKAGMAKKNPL